MKRTCWRCRAHGGRECELGYPTRIITHHYPPPNESITVDEMVPTAECPKPLTVSEYLRLREEHTRNRTDDGS